MSRASCHGGRLKSPIGLTSRPKFFITAASSLKSSGSMIDATNRETRSIKQIPAILPEKTMWQTNCGYTPFGPVPTDGYYGFQADANLGQNHQAFTLHGIPNLQNAAVGVEFAVGPMINQFSPFRTVETDTKEFQQSPTAPANFGLAHSHFQPKDAINNPGNDLPDYSRKSTSASHGGTATSAANKFKLDARAAQLREKLLKQKFQRDGAKSSSPTQLDKMNNNKIDNWMDENDPKVEPAKIAPPKRNTSFIAINSDRIGSTADTRLVSESSTIPEPDYPQDLSNDIAALIEAVIPAKQDERPSMKKKMQAHVRPDLAVISQKEEGETSESENEHDERNAKKKDRIPNGVQSRAEEVTRPSPPPKDPKTKLNSSPSKGKAHDGDTQRLFCPPAPLSRRGEKQCGRELRQYQHEPFRRADSFESERVTNKEVPATASAPPVKYLHGSNNEGRDYEQPKVEPKADTRELAPDQKESLKRLLEWNLDLKEWLELTGYADVDGRQRKLELYRKERQLDAEEQRIHAERKKLHKEKEKELKAGLKRPTSSLAGPGDAQPEPTAMAANEEIPHPKLIISAKRELDEENAYERVEKMPRGHEYRRRGNRGDDEDDYRRGGWHRVCSPHRPPTGYCMDRGRDRDGDSLKLRHEGYGSRPVSRGRDYSLHRGPYPPRQRHYEDLGHEERYNSYRPERDYPMTPGRDRDYGSESKYPKPVHLGYKGESRFFVIKSFNEQNVKSSMEDGVWVTQSANGSILTEAFERCKNVILFFSVNKSRAFQGYARMASAPSTDVFRPRWINGLHWCTTEPFRLEWLSKTAVEFRHIGHLHNSLNDDQPVLVAKDGQEVEWECGKDLLMLMEGFAERRDQRKCPRFSGGLIRRES